MFRPDKMLARMFVLRNVRQFGSELLMESRSQMQRSLLLEARIRKPLRGKGRESRKDDEAVK